MYPTPPEGGLELVQVHLVLLLVASLTLEVAVGKSLESVLR